MLDIHSFLTELAEYRPLFHSEADFQHAFAWQLHQKFPNAWIRLEYPFEVDKWIYVDIWGRFGDSHIAIELKYKTARLELRHSDELFRLKHQGAQDLGRYDFLKDVQRLEQVVLGSRNTVGYAIMLTNDPSYWTQRAGYTVDAAFRLHDLREINGVLKWDDRTGPGTMQGRSDVLTLVNRYSINWHGYSTVSAGPSGNFRYVALEVSTATSE